MSKRARMCARLTHALPRPAIEVRSFDAGDLPALAALMHRAYVGTVDYEGETPEQAAEEIRRTAAGHYGPLRARASKVVVRSGSPLAAALVTTFGQRPFVAYTFSEPALWGQGLARACMQAAMSELAADGERELHLVVTLANTRAVGLYASLGFEFVR